MAKDLSPNILGKLVGQGLAIKYSANSPEPQVDDVRTFAQAAETDENNATSTQAPETGDYQSILRSLKPTQPATAAHTSRSEYDIPVAGLADSELPRRPIDLSCSCPEYAPDNKGGNTGKYISGFKNWDAKTAIGYPVVALPPMTGIGRYRRSKTATKEWVEDNTLKQLGHIAPYVTPPIEDITSPSGWNGLYGKSRGEISKSGGKPPVEVDPHTGANVVRGFSTVSVAKNRRGSNAIGPVTNTPVLRTSAIPAVHSYKGTENRQANLLSLSYTEDDCAIESYDPFAPDVLQQGPSAGRGGSENAHVAAPPNPSSEVSYDDSVPEEFLALHGGAPTGAPETETENTRVDNPGAASPSDSYYDSVPEEYLASSGSASAGALETEPENTRVTSPAPSSASESHDDSVPEEFLALHGNPVNSRPMGCPGYFAEQDPGDRTGPSSEGKKGFTSEFENSKETGNSSEAESYLALRKAIYNDEHLPETKQTTQDTGNWASSYDSSKSERYIAVRDTILNDQPPPEFGSESQSAGSDAAPHGPDDGGDCVLGNHRGGYHQPHLNDYFEPIPPPNSAQRRAIAEFWDRAWRGEETSQQQTQNNDVELASASLSQIGSSSAMEVGGDPENTSSVMPAHTGPDMRFINRYWNRFYDNQQEEDAPRTQGIDVETEEGQESKEPLYAAFKTGTFEELEEYKVKESPPPSPLEPMEPRNADFGRMELPRKILYTKSKTRRGPVREDQESDSGETASGSRGEE